MALLKNRLTNFPEHPRLIFDNDHPVVPEAGNAGSDGN
jgi:hypothetical protein